MSWPGMAVDACGVGCVTWHRAAAGDSFAPGVLAVQLAERGGVIARPLHLPPQLVRGELGGRQVAEMLIDPVAHVGGADPPRPSRPGLVVAAPGGRGVPVVVHVVVVED